MIWIISTAEVEIPVIDLKNVFDVLDEDDDGASAEKRNDSTEMILMLVQCGSILMLDVPPLDVGMLGAPRYHLHQRNGSTGCLGGGASQVLNQVEGSGSVLFIDMVRPKKIPSTRQVKDALYLSELLDKGQEPSVTHFFGR